MKKNILTLIFLWLWPFSTFAITAIGLLEGENDLVLKTRSQGIVKEIYFEEGKHVLANTVIAKMDDKREIVETELAEHEMKSALADFQNSQKLKKFLSQDELNKKNEVYLKKKSVYELKLLDLETKKITTPIAGVIARIFIKVGENISSGEKVSEVVSPEKLLIELDVDAHLLGELKVGKSLPFSTELDKQRYLAEIFFVGEILDKASGTIHVKLKVDNSKNLLKPGSMVKVSLPD